MATIGGRGLTTEQLLAQVQGAISENLALRPPAPLVFDRFAAERGVRQPGNPLIVSADPAVADGPGVIAAPEPRQPSACKCRKRLDDYRCMETRVQEFQIPVVEPGTDILTRNPQRVSLYVAVFASSALLLRCLAFHARDSAFKVIPINDSITLTIEDYGPLVFEPWNALGQAAGSSIVVSETFIR